jgi:hypothetical protein
MANEDTRVTVIRASAVSNPRTGGTAGYSVTTEYYPLANYLTLIVHSGNEGTAVCLDRQALLTLANEALSAAMTM